MRTTQSKNPASSDSPLCYSWIMAKPAIIFKRKSCNKHIKYWFWIILPCFAFMNAKNTKKFGVKWFGTLKDW